MNIEEAFKEIEWHTRGFARGEGNLALLKTALYVVKGEHDRLASKLQMLTDMIEGDVTECEGMCPVVDRLTQELATTETRVRQECAETLGHVESVNPRCTARYKDPEHKASGPRNLPVWCDLPAGHEGPHRHVAGHRSSVMDREHLIEFVSLPSICKKCGTKWPCKDADAILHGQQAQVCEWERYSSNTDWFKTCIPFGDMVMREKYKFCPFCGKPIKIKETP